MEEHNCGTVHQTRKKLKACKQCLQTFSVKIADIFDQKHALSYIWVSQGDFTIWDDEKELAGI